MMVLADAWQLLKPGDMLTFLACIAVGLFIYNQILEAVLKSRQAYGRKPTLDEDYRSQQKIVEDLKARLSGLAPQQQVTELVKQLGSFATAQSVRDIEKLLPEFVRQREFDDRLVLLEAHISEGWRDVRREVEDSRRTSEAQREGMHNRMSVIAEVLYDIRGRLRAAAGEAL